jgi:hypothetical protein
MTLVWNEIHGMGADRQPLMIAAADRRISNPDGSYHSTRRKIFKVPRIAGAVSYFGLAAFLHGGKQVFLSEWLPSFIHKSRADSIAAFAKELQQSLNAVVPMRHLQVQHSGLHVCGFDTQGRPDFWYISNIGSMQGFEYKDLRTSYAEQPHISSEETHLDLGSTRPRGGHPVVTYKYIETVIFAFMRSPRRPWTML